MVAVHSFISEVIKFIKMYISIAVVVVVVVFFDLNPQFALSSLVTKKKVSRSQRLITRERTFCNSSEKNEEK